MPIAAPKACSTHGCSGRASTGRHCEACTKTKAERRRQTAADAQALYHTPGWRRLRVAVLLDQPLCAICQQRAATDVDHIDGDYRNMLRDNLQGLCRRCHSSKTAKQDGGFGAS